MRSRLLVGFHFTAALVLGAGALEACSVQTNGMGDTPDSSVADAETDASQDANLQDAEPEGGQDAGLGGDARPDAGQPDAACTGVRCDGKCLGATDCHSCSGAPLLCGSGICVASCSGCQDPQGVPTPIECFACDSNHANPIGTCQYADAGSYCLSGDYLGQYQGGPGYRCGCNDVSACPGATQVCVPLGNTNASFCLTCGETTVGKMQGQPCKDGGTCQTAQAVCQ